MDALATNIRDVRGELTQAAFADRLGVSKMTIQRWEAGSRLPCADDLLKIQEEFNININWLLTGNGIKHLSEMDSSRHGQAEVVCIENGFIEAFKAWMAELIGQDPAYRGWFKIQLMKCFPEFEEWSEKKQRGESSEDSGPLTHENSA